MHSEHCTVLLAIHQSDETSSDPVSRKTAHKYIIKEPSNEEHWTQPTDLMENRFHSDCGVIVLFNEPRVAVTRQVWSNDLPRFWQVSNENQPVMFVNGDAVNKDDRGGRISTRGLRISDQVRDINSRN